MQYRRRDQSLFAEFDFGQLADVSHHPDRLQCEQFKLARILPGILSDNPLCSVRFNAALAAAEDHGDKVTAVLDDRTHIVGSYLIGADGARSAVRKSASIGLDGFTWSERFLLLSTEFDFSEIILRLANVPYDAGH